MFRRTENFKYDDCLKYRSEKYENTRYVVSACQPLTSILKGIVTSVLNGIVTSILNGIVTSVLNGNAKHRREREYSLFV